LLLERAVSAEFDSRSYDCVGWLIDVNYFFRSTTIRIAGLAGWMDVIGAAPQCWCVTTGEDGPNSYREHRGRDARDWAIS